ncbi:MAG: BREX-1 system adenine-specific DNA-methyltransferase PglX, partial [Lachnospiraceae bacterium]
TSNLLAEEFWYKQGVTYSAITSRGTGFRYLPEGCIFDKGGPAINLLTDIPEILALLNTNVAKYYFWVFNPSINLQVKDIKKFPILLTKNKDIIDMALLNLDYCHIDWDSFETSWDFVKHPFLKQVVKFNHGYLEDTTIEKSYNSWLNECDKRFNQLKANEEELNRIFIDIYGLHNELTPDVEERDVTVRRADLHRDIKSLLSYFIGCMFGRYSLDTEGLAYAGGEWDETKYKKFKPNPDNIIHISDEEYLEDDIITRLCTWLKVVYGEETLEVNLDFIAEALGNKGNTSREIIRNYFLNDFFKDHCQTYSVTGSGKRPIYWLFDSGKQNGFKALIYLHRYNADTIGNLRIDYLHRMQRIYESEINRMQDTINNSTNAREVAAATKRKEKLTKQLKECREYDEKIAHLALSRIELDLDDGVKVNYKKLQTGVDGKFYEVLADSKNIMIKEK